MNAKSHSDMNHKQIGRIDCPSEINAYFLHSQKVNLLPKYAWLVALCK